MENSKIAWTDHSFNPWVGCSPVSEACDNCYAAAMNKRWGQDFSVRRRTSAANWEKPHRWNRQAEQEGRRYRVFCGSMCDVFDGDVPTVWRHDLWGMVDATPALDWLLLTKRPEQVPLMQLPETVWVGITAENAQRLAERSRYLNLRHPKLFVSVEPMLGPIAPEALEPFAWVIVGAEKIGTRPGRLMREEWVREIVERRKGPTFVKQMDVGGRVTDDPEQFPAWARRREFGP